MDDEIDASPTSQKKRKRISKCYHSQKISKTDEDNNLNRGVMTMDLKSNQTNNPVDSQPIEVSDCLTRNDILQYVVQMEKADKVRVTPPETCSVIKRYNNRKSGRDGFIRLSATQPSASLNVDEVKDSQWNVTVSQIRKIDDAVKEFHDSELKGRETGTSDSHQIRDENVVDDSQNDREAENTNSLKRRSSVLESIFSDWATSPPKINKCRRDVMALSPPFVFYKKRTKKTYFRKHVTRETPDILPAFKVSSHCSRIDGLESSHRVPADHNDDEDDLNESVNNNIQILNQFYSQSDPIENDVNETFKTIMTSKSIDLHKPSASLYDEEDFAGFDVDALITDRIAVPIELHTVPIESITVPERFHEFDSHSEKSSTHSTANVGEQDHDLLMEDDDIFANFQTQQYVANNQATEPVASTSADFKGKCSDCVEINFGFSRFSEF